MASPRISIVTPCLNRARYLGAAIESVRAQNFPDVEHIVVDGMSTDGTVELLERYPHLRVIREPDTGLYDALNKGLRAASGDIVGHLNSDDLYAPGVFAAVAEAFADPQVDAVFGGAEVFEGDTPEERRVVRRFTRREEIELSVFNTTVGVPITNARFFHRRVYERVGYTDLRYRIAADRDFLLRVALTEPRAVLLDRIIYQYRMHPGSLTINRDEAAAAKVRDEYLAIAEDFLAKPGLPEVARRCCRQWHERESALAALRALQGGAWTRFRYYARRGLRTNAAWPVMLARHFAGEIRDRLLQRETA